MSSTDQKPLDLTKPVRTRDGRKVRILCTDGPGKYPICGYKEGFDAPCTWRTDGRFADSGAYSGNDLVNIEPEPVTMWIPLFLGSDGKPFTSRTLYTTKESAEVRIGLCANFIATVPVTFTPKE